jgi:signal transduction histidine kinase
MIDTIILYIEDNHDNQRLVQRILASKGYQLLLADDGPAGLALAREHSPALILVDLGIDGLDGYETTTRLRGMPHLAQTPIVAITANSSPSSRERALVAGCDGFLAKPIDPRQLPQQLAQFMAGQREALPEGQEAPLLRAYTLKLVERLEQQVNELSSANAELQEVDRLKSEFIGSLSHELRTPLTSVMGFLDLFDKGTLGPLNNQQREALTVMMRNVHLLNRQIGSLLYLQEARTVQLRRTSVSIDVLLRRLVSELQEAAKRVGVSLLGHNLHVPIPAYDGDLNALDLALRHLLENAIAFTPSGGQVQVDLRDESTRVLIRVADTGIGIAPEDLEKIFLPFYQVDAVRRGTGSGNGLGLTIARHSIQAHGGQLHVRSAVGQGSIFSVVLPRLGG